MVETRIATRYRVNKPAKIDHGGDKINCIIRDLSATGAALEISDIARVPANFTLIIPEDRLRLGVASFGARNIESGGVRLASVARMSRRVARMRARRYAPRHPGLYRRNFGERNRVR